MKPESLVLNSVLKSLCQSASTVDLDPPRACTPPTPPSPSLIHHDPMTRPTSKHCGLDGSRRMRTALHIVMWYDTANGSISMKWKTSAFKCLTTDSHEKNVIETSVITTNLSPSYIELNSSTIAKLELTTHY